MGSPGNGRQSQDAQEGWTSAKAFMRAAQTLSSSKNDQTASGVASMRTWSCVIFTGAPRVAESEWCDIAACYAVTYPDPVPWCAACVISRAFVWVLVPRCAVCV